MTVAFTIDPTYGPYLQTVTIGGRTWTYFPNFMFTCRVYANPPGVEADLSSANFSVASFTQVAGVNTITFNGVTVPGLNIKLTMTETATGLDFKAPEIIACPAGVAVMNIRFPLVTVQNNGADADAFGVLGGGVVPQPKDNMDVVGAMIIVPPSLMYMGIYDAGSKSCMSLLCDDEEGHLVTMKMTGTGVGTTLYAEHVMDRRYTLGTLSAKTYKTRLEIIQGISVDGRQCYQDINENFRNWFTDASRPWMSRGRWPSATSVSSYVKDIGLVYNAPMLTSDLATSVLNIGSFIGGVNNLLLRTRFCDNTMADHSPDPQVTTLDSDYVTAFNTLKGSGVNISVYTISRMWLNTLNSPFDPDNFSTYGDLKPMMLHSLAGSAKQDAAGNYVFDFTHASTDDVILELIAGFRTLHRNEALEPDGYYLDVHTSYSANGMQIEVEDLAADTTWTHKAHRDGIGSTLSAIKTARRFDAANAVIGTEVVDTKTVHINDLVGIYRPYHSYEAGNDTRSQTYIAGEICRAAVLDGAPVFDGTDNNPYVYATIQGITRHWLATGLVCISDLTTSGVAPVDPTGDILWTHIKKLVDMATGPAYNYFRGKRVRGQPDDFSLTLESAALVAGQDINIVVYGGPYPVQTAMWQKTNNEVNLLAVHCFQTGMAGLYNDPTPGDRTIPVTIVPAAYSLPAAPHALVRQSDGEVISQWYAGSTHATEVTLSEGDVEMFEIIKSGETTITSQALTSTLTVTPYASNFIGFSLTMSAVAGPQTLVFRSSVTHKVFFTAVFQTAGSIFFKGVRQSVPDGESIEISGGGGATFVGSVYWEI